MTVSKPSKPLRGQYEEFSYTGAPLGMPSGGSSHAGVNDLHNMESSRQKKLFHTPAVPLLRSAPGATTGKQNWQSAAQGHRCGYAPYYRFTPCRMYSIMLQNAG